jgi:F-type H+-transporting ATPase subunit delta
VDPDLLGGLVIRVGDWVYDASVRTRLAKIRDQLVERSSHATAGQ